MGADAASTSLGERAADAHGEHDRAPIATVVFDADATPIAAAGPNVAPARSVCELPALDDEEAALLRQLERAGVALVCLTAAEEARAQVVFTAAGVHPLILSDECAGQMPPEGLSRGAARVHAVLTKSGQTVTNLQETCVIASQPADCELLLEAGVAFALEGAGYRAHAAADAVFAPRGEGGLALALACACRLATCGVEMPGA